MRRKKAQSLTGVSKTYRFKHSEHSEQVGFVNWFRAKYPHTLIFAIPNGEKRSISVATRLKAEGVTRGIPDLYIPSCNLWVEMKRATGGRLSPDQKKVIEYLRSVGHTVIAGKGAGDASKQVLEFLDAK